MAWRRRGDKLIGLSIDVEELQSASRALEARVDEALAGNRELQSDVQCLDSGLVDEEQEPPDELNSLTEDDLPSEIPSSDVALRELEEFLRQHQQDPGPHSGKGALRRRSRGGATIRAIRPDVHRVPRSASE